MTWNVSKSAALFALLLTSSAYANVKVIPTYKLHDVTNKGRERLVRPSDENSQDPATSGYVPSQIWQAYSIDSTVGLGDGQTIAIVVAYGSSSLTGDLAGFDLQFNLPTANISVWIQPGTVTVGSDDSWAVETTLDVEWAHAIAPNAKIVVAIAKSESLDDMLGAVDYAATQASIISMSWGSSESNSLPDEPTLDSHFSDPTKIFLASAGDSGSGVLYPCASAYVICVGGTSLELDANGDRVVPEVTWSGTGGGISSGEATFPSQNYYTQNANREVPDVSYSADPNYGFDVYLTSGGFNGWIEVGGTSAGTPQWASLMALVAQKRGASNSLTSALNTVYDTERNHGMFTDITSGCNNSGDTQCAVSGYDDVTGLGTPVTNALVPAMGAASSSAVSVVGYNSSSSSAANNGAASSASSSGGGCGQSSGNATQAEVTGSLISSFLPVLAGAFVRRKRIKRSES